MRDTSTSYFVYKKYIKSKINKRINKIKYFKEIIDTLEEKSLSNWCKDKEVKLLITEYNTRRLISYKGKIKNYIEKTKIETNIYYY